MLGYATEKLRTRLQKMAFDTAVNKVSVTRWELSATSMQTSEMRTWFANVRELVGEDSNI